VSELDWSPIHADHRARLQAAFEGGNVTQETINSLAVTYPAEGYEAVAEGGSYVVRQAPAHDSLRAAVVGRTVAQQRLTDADETFRLEIRAAYRAGATAAELAEIVGLSLQRVHQLVAGARK
jgi:hypothetical protein